MQDGITTGLKDPSAYTRTLRNRSLLLHRPDFFSEACECYEVMMKRMSAGHDQQTNDINDLLPCHNYANTLPEPPYRAKFIHRKKNFDSFIKCRERPSFNDRRSVLSEFDLGVKIDFVDPNAYKTRIPPPKIHWKDELLLQHEMALNQKMPNVFIKPLREPTAYGQTHRSHSEKKITKSIFDRDERIETKVGYRLEKEGEVYKRKNRGEQIKDIEQTFEDAKTKCEAHPYKPGVTAVEETFILPDFRGFPYNFVSVNFPACPNPRNVPEELKTRAITLGHLIPEGEKWAHFVPDIYTINNLLEAMSLDDDVEEDDRVQTEYSYLLDREYGERPSAQSEGFYFNFNPEHVYYAPIDENIDLIRMLHQNHTEKQERVISARSMDSEEQIKVHHNLMRLTHDEISSEDEDSEQKENSDDEQSSDVNESSSSSQHDTSIDNDDRKPILTTHYEYKETNVQSFSRIPTEPRTVQIKTEPVSPERVEPRGINIKLEQKSPERVENRIIQVKAEQRSPERIEPRVINVKLEPISPEHD